MEGSSGCKVGKDPANFPPDGFFVDFQKGFKNFDYLQGEEVVALFDVSGGNVSQNFQSGNDCFFDVFFEVRNDDGYDSPLNTLLNFVSFVPLLLVGTIVDV